MEAIAIAVCASCGDVVTVGEASRAEWKSCDPAWVCPDCLALYTPRELEAFTRRWHALEEELERRSSENLQ